MVLFRKLLSLSFLNLSLKKGLVLHHHFGANIRESESHWEEQISSRRLFERWAERARGRRRWRERGRAEFRGVLGEMDAAPAAAGKSAHACAPP